MLRINLRSVVFVRKELWDKDLLSQCYGIVKDLLPIWYVHMDSARVLRGKTVVLASALDLCLDLYYIKPSNPSRVSDIQKFHLPFNHSVHWNSLTILDYFTC